MADLGVADAMSRRVIGFAIDVYRALGPGLLESAYEECLAYELGAASILFRRQVAFPVLYKGRTLDCGFRADFLVSDCLLLEIKAIERVLPIHEAQLLTYLRMTGLRLGLILNFNAVLLKDGIKRMML